MNIVANTLPKDNKLALFVNNEKLYHVNGMMHGFWKKPNKEHIPSFPHMHQMSQSGNHNNRLLS